MRELPSDFLNFLIKTLPFSLAALAISISIQVKNKTATIIGVILSVIIGVSFAYLTGSFVNSNFSREVAPIVIGIITIIGEKAAYWLIYKFKFDVLGDAIVGWIKSKINK